MNLIVDVGNTTIKFAVFEHGELLHKEIVERGEALKSLQVLFNEFSGISDSILSAVGAIPAELISVLQEKSNFHHLSHSSKLPFSNTYKSQSTLGVDRMALASAACLHFPKQDVLVIDAGSCVTYDLIAANNQYLGGVISPGIAMRYKAMHTFTANLPSLERKFPKKIIGDDTHTSMHLGVVQAICHEIDGFIAQYRKKYNQLQVVFTGGDALFLRDSIKNDIFAHSNFLLDGLNYLLELNKD